MESLIINYRRCNVINKMYTRQISLLAILCLLPVVAFVYLINEATYLSVPRHPLPTAQARHDHAKPLVRLKPLIELESK